MPKMVCGRVRPIVIAVKAIAGSEDTSQRQFRDLNPWARSAPWYSDDIRKLNDTEFSVALEKRIGASQKCRFVLRLLV